MKIYGPIVAADLENLSSDPTGVEGRVYLNTTTHNARIYTNGAWTDLGSGTPASGGGGGSSVLWLPGDTSAPEELFEYNGWVDVFDPALSQFLYLALRVPPSYVAGTKIQLASLFYSQTNGGTNIMAIATTLYRPGTSSANSALATATTSATVTMTGVYSIIEGTIDLTDASGKVGAQSVAAGDMLWLQLYRSGGTETLSTRMIKNSSRIIGM